MKTTLALLGAVFCMASSAQAVLWTGEIYFNTTSVPVNHDWWGYDPDPTWWGYAPLGESILWSTYVFESSGDRPDGSYGTQSGFGVDSWRISLFGDPLPHMFGLAEWSDYYMHVADGTVAYFEVIEGDFSAVYSSDENYFWEDWTWGTISITAPRRGHPIPDTGSTLPLAALSLLGLTGLRLAIARRVSSAPQARL